MRCKMGKIENNFSFRDCTGKVLNQITSSLVPGAVAIDNLIQANRYGEIQWIPCSNIVDIRSSQIDNVYYAARKQYGDVIMILIGSNETCTPALVSEFARIYSFPTHEYHSDMNNFKRYTEWLGYRNRLICGFTEHDNSYYMVADKRFYHCYSRYGFCPACRILRCSPVWCICGHKQLSDGWSSNNKSLDEFIKKSQLQTTSANDAYLEWTPFDCIHDKGYNEGYGHLYGLPTRAEVKLTPLEETGETDDLYYDKLCDQHPDIPTTDVWVTTGFTYDARKQKYCLIKEWNGSVLCLACTKPLEYNINAFCYHCKAPTPLDWTTGNKSLDLFIMESWSNMTRKHDSYLQWIEYSLLSNVQKMTSLRHGCTHIADWLEPTFDRRTKVALKKIVDKRDDQLFDFHQLTKKYPEILTPDNIWIVGITRESSTGEYYLVFYHEIQTIVDRSMQLSRHVEYIQYGDFDEIKEIGSDGYVTVCTAKYKRHSEVWHIPEIVVLKRFKNFDQMPELFISELRNHAKCLRYDFLQLYGVTQDPETKEYIIVMQHANNGSLLSYLDQNINKLTWKTKLRCLKYIALHLSNIHHAELVHCNLNGESIVMHETRTFICDLGHSRSIKSLESLSVIRGVLLFTAPEIFHTRTFTQKSDIYSLGIIMYLMATGEQPFQDRQFNGDLICDIMGGLRPTMPDSAPEEYKKLAEWCCDADPDKRPDAMTISDYIDGIIKKMRRDNFDNDIWDTVYHNNVRPLSCYEK